MFNVDETLKSSIADNQSMPDCISDELLFGMRH